MLRRIFRLLGKRGCLIMSVRGPRDVLTAHREGTPCGDGYLTPNHTFVRSYTRAELDSLLLASGFRSVMHLHKPASHEPELLHIIARKGL
jgi:hypothetical protein